MKPLRTLKTARTPLSPALIALTLCLLLTACNGEPEHTPETLDQMERELDFDSRVHFLSAEDDTITTIRSAVAESEEERNAGLMDIENLPEDSGMLFLFDDEQQRSFWMANTPLSLDIIYVNSDMEIVRIHQGTTPFSERQYRSDEPAQYAVEVNSGFTINHDIVEGMRIAYER